MATCFTLISEMIMELFGRKPAQAPRPPWIQTRTRTELHQAQIHRLFCRAKIEGLPSTLSQLLDFVG